jgi:hypothetical protein
MKAKSGGGINSRVVSNKREGTREQPRTRGVSPGGVADLGSMKGSHSTVKGDMPFKPRAMYGEPSYPTKFGNELATNVGGGGCGTGRTIYKTGSQAQHGSANQGSSPARRDILGAFGPNKRIG